MLDYNFLRPPCMLAPYPKGFFIGTWEDYRGGVPLAEPTYLSFICDGWSIKSRPGTFSPHRSPKKPIMGVGGGEGGGRKVGSHYSFISFLSAPENAPPSEKAQKCQIEAWKRDLSQKWVSTIWSSFASIHQLCHQRRKIGTETGRGKKQLCLPPPASLSRPLLTFPENAGSLSCAKLSNPLWERNNCPHSF